MDPLKELEGAIVSFNDPSKTFGTLGLSAACAFPARKLIIEKYLNLKFPESHCPELASWLKRIHANQLSISFAGAYSGNPASILGHTFLRYSYENLVTNKNTPHELLSHAVGFLAVSPPDDSRAMYMVRGLTGQYPGFYQIEPFYIKVGLYNNSESRDIWEQKLNFTPDEVEFSLKVLWEYSFNAQIPYYFIDENCSYRLLSFLEVIRPELNLTDQLQTVVLPADTVRVLLKNNVASMDSKFKSSILRRLNHKIHNLSENEKLSFEKAKHSEQELENTSTSTLDALIDYWTYKNYRAETKLAKEDAKLMEKTYIFRSQKKITSPELNDEDLIKDANLKPPYLSHKSSWFELLTAHNLENKVMSHLKLSYRMGVHGLTDDPSGYEDISAIEYLGFDIETQSSWRALLIDAIAIEPLNRPNKNWSWLADISLDKEHFYHKDKVFLNLKVGGGGAVSVHENFKSKIKLYFIPLLKAEISENESDTKVGLLLGSLFQFKKMSLNLKYESLWGLKQQLLTTQIDLNYFVKTNNSLVTMIKLQDYKIKDFKSKSQNQIHLGYKWHF